MPFDGSRYTQSALDGLDYPSMRDRLWEWFHEVCFDPEQEQRSGIARRYRWRYGDIVDPKDVLLSSFPKMSRQLIDHVSWELSERSSNWRLRPDELGPGEVTRAEEAVRRDPEQASKTVSDVAEELRDAALEQLERLESAISGFEPPPSSLGHNRPPEPINDEPWSRDDFLELQETVIALQKHVAEARPDKEAIAAGVLKVESAGERLRTWAAERGTKLTDSFLGAAGKTIGAGLGAALILKATNLLPIISDVVQAVERFLGVLV